VYSELGLGTAFKVYLPRDREAGPSPKASSDLLVPLRGTETILVVEDEDGVRALARQILEGFGYQVLDARQGAEAIGVCEQQPGPIDLLITDVVMPGMSGRQVAEQVAERRPGLRVLFLSGYTDDAIVHHGVLDLGMPFLQKPFSPMALALKVRQVLDDPDRKRERP
jgi:CheY-like chemotaxis protein